MTHDYLHALTGLAVVPGFTQLRLDVTRQDGDPYAFALQDALQPTDHVTGAGINRKDMRLAPTTQLHRTIISGVRASTFAGKISGAT